jgi:hypothetical protein
VNVEEMREGFRMAGITFLELVPADRPLVPPAPASFARHVAPGVVADAVCIDVRSPDLVERVNEEWYRMCVDVGVFSEENPEFLACVEPDDPDFDPDVGPALIRWAWWARVRLTPDWDLSTGPLGLFGRGPRHPDFVMLSTDGTTSIHADEGEITVDMAAVSGVNTNAALRQWCERYLHDPQIAARGRDAFRRWLAATGG